MMVCSRETRLSRARDLEGHECLNQSTQLQVCSEKSEKKRSNVVRVITKRERKMDIVKQGNGSKDVSRMVSRMWMQCSLL
jgi:hypothetical protein